MRAYLIRRVLLLIPTLFLLTAFVFLSVRFIPGDVIDVMSERSMRAGGAQLDREAMEKLLGLDQPVHMQYANWIGGMVLHGTFGTSLHGRTYSIEQIIARRLPITMELGLLAIVIALAIALPVGVYSAMRQDTAADYVGRSAAIIGLATPNFWLGMLVIVFPSIWWQWQPPLEHVSFRDAPLRNLGFFIIPAAIVGTAMAASTMRMTRTMMLEVLRQDYVRTAWSKGLREKVVVVRHAIKNAFIPVATLIGLELPILIGGSVIIENVFNIPGLGRLAVEALNLRDYPTVSAVNMLFATGVMAVNLAIDLIYPYLDPRVRYQ